jgi:hypothetical protein
MHNYFRGQHTRSLLLKLRKMAVLWGGISLSIGLEEKEYVEERWHSDHRERSLVGKNPGH